MPRVDRAAPQDPIPVLTADSLGGQRFAARDLKRIVEVLSQGGRLVEYFPKGQPLPDVVHGTIQVGKKDVGRVLQRLVDLRGVRVQRLEVFPLGIPVIDELMVRTTLGPEGGR